MRLSLLTFAMAVLIFGGSVLSASASAQATEPRGEGTQQTGQSGLRTPSNPWESLPRITPYHCLAEAIGTAADPNTGAPVRASIDPQTGKPICPPQQPTAEAKPKR